jgi:DNA-binding transcriptional ArsR family regulator
MMDIIDKEMHLLEYLRPTTTRRIILFLLYSNDKCTFNDIVSHINRAQSTVSSQLKKLRDAGLVSIRKDKNYRHQYYELRYRSAISKALSKYKTAIRESDARK